MGSPRNTFIGFNFSGFTIPAPNPSPKNTRKKKKKGDQREGGKEKLSFFFFF